MLSFSFPSPVQNAIRTGRKCFSFILAIRILAHNYLRQSEMHNDIEMNFDN